MNPQSEELSILIDAYVSGRATDEQVDKLTERLQSDEAAREWFVEMADTHACMAVDESLWVSTQSSQTTPSSSKTRSVMLRAGVRPVIAYAGWLTAVVAIIMICLPMGTPDDNEESGTALALSVDRIPAARMTQQIAVEWQDDTEARVTGEPLDGKWVRVSSGIIQVEFASGAQLGLQGPAELRIDSDMGCFLQSGRLTVLAPPEASEFTVTSPAGKVVDLGTEFGIVVDSSGQMDVHVLEGEVEVASSTEPDPGKKKTLLENEAVTVSTEAGEFAVAEIDRAAFESIRHETLLASKPLKLQFDCGSRAGLYQGVESPAHAAGDMSAHEVFWNSIVGDQLGNLTLADGSVTSSAIELDYGSSRTQDVEWGREPNQVRSSFCQSSGVFDTALGRDRLRDAGTIGLRIRGLPAGTYRVFFIGRLTDTGTTRGDFLTNKAFRSAIGVNLDAIPDPHEIIMPVEDSGAAQWVDGQTHLVGEVTLSGPDDYLTVLTRKSKQHSPVASGGHSAIAGVQIVQITDSDN
jgi:hypothetical protein